MKIHDPTCATRLAVYPWRPQRACNCTPVDEPLSDPYVRPGMGKYEPTQILAMEATMAGEKFAGGFLGLAAAGEPNKFELAQQAAIKAGAAYTTPRFCVDCKWHQENFADLHVCDRPISDLVTGISRPNGKKCAEERSGLWSSDCGPDACLFEPK